MKRKKVKLKYKKERVVFSDVLPYELPLVFTNRYFYRFLVQNQIQIKMKDDADYLCWSKDADEAVVLMLSLLFNDSTIVNNKEGQVKIKKRNLKTIPFVYSIQHKPTKHRYLSLIHPANQIKVVEFYNKYKDAILYLCSKSNFSMRYPHKVASYFFYKDRLLHVLLGRKTDKMEMFFSEYENLKTYFSYKKYTNIYKFYEDYRYQRAEKKFEYLQKTDIQSCFDSIYTHTIAWAISGGRDIYKDSFDGTENKTLGVIWDSMMQEMNYNETNGIVIGPEFSRLFAEAILQHIDQRVEQDLLKIGLRHRVDYECHRYVDDYFFFYNSDDVRIQANELFKKYLKEFKLTLGSEKSTIIQRPFITPITKAKIDIDSLLDDTIKLCYDGHEEPPMTDEDIVEHAEQDLAEEVEPVIMKVDVEKLKACLADEIYFKMKATTFNKHFKQVVDDNGVDPKDVMNYTLARVAIMLERVLKKFDKTYKVLCVARQDLSLRPYHNEAEKMCVRYERMLASFLYQVLDAVFFLYANSKRINTTLKVIQILDIVRIYLDNPYGDGKRYPQVKRFTDYARELVFKKIKDEISLVFQTTPIDTNNQLETLYFLLVLRSLNNKYNLSISELEKYLGIQYNDKGEIKGDFKLNAMSVTMLVYYMGNIDVYQNLKEKIINRCLAFLDTIPENRRKISAEYVILALDMAACPYIMPSSRYKFLQKIGVSQKNAAIIVSYMKRQKYMFTKWTGVNLTKEINAKISQEVYS